MSDNIYDPERMDRLVRLLRALSARIAACRSDEELLKSGPELLRLMGDARSELFHYEVRSTYDSPETAEHRRIVEEARRALEAADFDPEDDEPWRSKGH
ncbi:MAG: hypothetical protein WD934_02785 [Gemmatimonadales bacterium]